MPRKSALNSSASHAPSNIKDYAAPVAARGDDSESPPAERESPPAAALDCEGVTEESDRGAEGGAGLGLMDGFEHFLTPSARDYETVLQSGVVTLDANVLLDFYRFAKVTRGDLVQVLERLGGRLHITHQAADEFWRNREGTLQSYDTSLNSVKQKLVQLIDKGEQAISEWANAVSLPSKQKSSVVESWARSAQRIVERLDSLGIEHSSAISFKTGEDEVLSQLADLLRSRVGRPPPPEEAAIRRTEGARRIAKKIPPGYMDKSKEESKAVGDYLIWAEVLHEAKARQMDVLFVTRDAKEDWWHIPPRGRPVARRELQAEFRESSGRRVFMLETSDFLRMAADVFKLRIKEDSIRDAGRPARTARRSAGVRGLQIDKLGGGRPGETYASIVIRMLELCEDSGTYEQLVDDYMLAFPSITVRSEARRRIDNLFALALVETVGGVVTLTEPGQRLLKTQDADVLRRQFLNQIVGAEDIVRASRDGTLPSLREDPPAGMSETQVAHVLRWASQLSLINGPPDTSTVTSAGEGQVAPEE
jgi:hypothetical protein